MTYAIAILNWNGRALLEQFLPSVTQFSQEAQIYLIDNASTDDSVHFTQQNYPQIAIIQHNTNGGFSKAYNDAMPYIKEDVVCLLNSDVEVTQDWLQPIQTLFEKHQNLAVAQPKLLDFKAKNKFEYAGAAGGFMDKLGYPYCRGRIFDTVEPDLQQYDDEKNIFWASGAAFFIKKTVFEEVGGLDEDYFAHQEEIDLCWRVQNYGHEVMYTSKSVVYHVGGATLSAMNPKKTFLNFRNSLFSLLKNLPYSKALPIIFIRLILDGVAGLKFLAGGEFKHCWAIIKAHFSFYYHIRSICSKKYKFKPQYSPIFYPISIVWNYYAKGQKTFNDVYKNVK